MRAECSAQRCAGCSAFVYSNPAINKDTIGFTNVVICAMIDSGLIGKNDKRQVEI